MLHVTGNHKNQYTNIKCRFCAEEDETQQHVIQVCKNTKHAKIEYNKIFTETDPQTLKEIAEQLLNITQTLDNEKADTDNTDA